MTNPESTILSIYNTVEYQQLKEYYSKSTIFSTLGIARSENRHSAFLAWLLDAAGDHKLGTEPLKKLLGLYSLLSDNICNSLKMQLITGHYSLVDVKVSTEETLANYDGGQDVNDKLKRLDIVCTFTIVPMNAESADEASIKAVLVIENKIYSNEGTQGGRSQTQIYHECMSAYCNMHGVELLEIFLTPNEKQTPGCNEYCKLTYQELLDSVITPLSFIKTDSHTSLMISDYIRNLGVPAFNMDDKGTPMEDYTIMATSKEEIARLDALYLSDGFADLFTDTLLAKFKDKAFSLCGEDAQNRYRSINPDKLELLTEFWDANVNIFKAIMSYVTPFSGMDCDFLFKKSNRDNSKYRVSYNGDYIFPEKRALSKGMTALAIFHAYVRKNQDKDLSIQDLNKAFPCKDLNEYYYKNYYKDIFYPYAEQLYFDCANKTHNGKDSRAVWDFHVKPSQQLVISNGTQKVMAVKMWRKSDFERLLAHVMAHQEWFDGITIEEA